MRFPNGVPAVSDADQSEWMLYVYKQFSQPTDVTGVPVSIDAVDPNGNYIHLGDATSDASGRFHLEYTPDTEGSYVIYATFGGSAAYYHSFAQNAISSISSTRSNTNTNTTSHQPTLRDVHHRHGRCNHHCNRSRWLCSSQRNTHKNARDLKSISFSFFVLIKILSNFSFCEHCFFN